MALLASSATALVFVRQSTADLVVFRGIITTIVVTRETDNALINFRQNTVSLIEQSAAVLVLAEVSVGGKLSTLVAIVKDLFVHRLYLLKENCVFPEQFVHNMIVLLLTECPSLTLYRTAHLFLKYGNIIGLFDDFCRQTLL